MENEIEAPTADSNSINRRTFVQRLIAGAGAAAISPALWGATEGTPAQPPAQKISETIASPEWLKLTGYTNQFSVQPGEKLQFMVSSDEPRYRADIVRLIHGDVNPKGPGFKEVAVDSPVSGEYPGERQPLRAGSSVIVPDAAALRLDGSFTLQAWVAATTPGRGPQAILTKWLASERQGYALVLEEDGSLALWIGDAAGKVAVAKTGIPLRAFIPADVFEQLNYPVGQMASTQSWYFVAATFDASTRKVTLYQEPMGSWPPDNTAVTAEHAIDVAGPARPDCPLLMAAFWHQHDSSSQVSSGHFNGKIASPAIFGRALTSVEIRKLKEGERPSGVIAAWDFSTEIGSRKVVDTGANQLNGETFNRPTRAMTGPNWSARELRFTLAPDEYGAIYFHDDDLDDARWKPGFEYTVPATLPSGLYAARIRAGGREDHIPFVVRPRRGTANAHIAVLLPTFTYLAYGNLRAGIPELVSLYSRHSDGSGVMYASQRRPIMQLRPKFHERAERYVRHLGADLYLIDWLTEKGFEFDVITDHDLDSEGASLLAPYPVVVTGSHPEYTSAPMLDAVQHYQKNGGRLMYLGGNGFYWVASRSPSDGSVLELRRNHGTELWAAAPGEYYHSTTGELGGLWRFRGRPPQKYVGVGFAALGNGKGRPYHRMPGSFDPRAKFIFAGIGTDELIGDYPSLVKQYGAASDEVDRFDFGLGTPPHALHVASATGFDDSFQPATEEVLLSDPKLGGVANPQVRADMVFFECPGEGAVFSVGTMSWFAALSYNNYNNTVSRVTENVLRRFVSNEPWTMSSAGTAASL